MQVILFLTCKHNYFLRIAEQEYISFQRRQSLPILRQCQEKETAAYSPQLPRESFRAATELFP